MCEIKNARKRYEFKTTVKKKDKICCEYRKRHAEEYFILYNYNHWMENMSNSNHDDDNNNDEKKEKHCCVYLFDCILFM